MAIAQHHVDAQRDQLARNIEASWLVSLERKKDEFCVLLCHETDLGPEEQALIDGYRSGELTTGLPHVDEPTRLLFPKRIGTLTWADIVNRWPALQG